jgi:lipopolysaccharide export LptBFGC system permease protein LptF
MVPALLAGLVMAAALFVVDAWLRPAAIHVQIAQKLGREGIRLDRAQSGGNHWIALPDGLLRAEIEYGPPLKLHDVTVYKLDSDGHLAEVDTAALAVPLSKDLWRLEEGRSWHAPAAEPGNVLSTSASREEAETPFRTRAIAMVLDELWLRNLGLSPQYLRLGDLRELAHARIMSRDLNAYQTRSQLIFGEAVLTVTMALIGAALAMLYFAFQTRWVALVGVLLAGYLAHFASKAFQLMGEFGYMAPFFAGWLAPILLILGVIWVLHIIQKRRGLGTQLGDTPHYADSTSG